MTKPNESLIAWKVMTGIMGLFALIMIILAITCSCTISFQNISTHGTATDVVDENLKTDPTVNPNISIPISGI